MRPLTAVLLGFIAIASTACSTMASYETIAFESEPQGAEVSVRCGRTHVTTVTPSDVLVPRNTPDCAVTIRKEGYREERLVLTSNAQASIWNDSLAMAVMGGGVLITSSTGGGIDGEVAGEFLVTGLVPWIFNVATCASCAHDPQEVMVVLRPRSSHARN